MAELNDITIKIGADATSATKAIDNLVGALSQLSTSLGNLNNVSKLGELADNVTKLATASANLKDTKTSFNSLASSLEKLNGTQINNLTNVASGLSGVSTAISGLSNANIGAITTTVSAIRGLGSQTGGNGTSNLKTLATDLKSFTDVIATIPEGSQGQFTTITNLVNNVRSLGTKTANSATSNLKTLGNDLASFVNQMNSIGSVNFNTESLTRLIDAISRIGYATGTKATQNLRPLADNLKYLFETLSRCPNVSKNLISMTRALANLTANMGNVRSVSQKASSGLNLFGNSAKSARKHTLSLASAFGKFYATYFLLVRAIGALGKGVQKAMNAIEVENYFENALKQVGRTSAIENGLAGTDGADAYIDNFVSEIKTRQSEITEQLTGYQYNDSTRMMERTNTKNLGLSPNEVIQYQAQFMQMADSMGASADNAEKLSNAMIKLGGDLASLRDVDFSEAFNSLSSGLVGMSKVMDKFGINIRVSALNEQLANMGIDTTVAKLNAEDKALLRTIVMLDRSRSAWTDLSRTLESPSNQLRILKNNMSALGMSIGNILLAGIARVLPYINALVKALQTLMQWIVRVFGIQLPEMSATGSSGISDLNDVLEDSSDAMDDASASAKKLKNNLLGIDELNVLSDNGGSGTGTGSSYNGEELQSAFDALYDEYMKAWDQAYANMEDKIQGIADKIINAFKNGDYSGIGEYIADNIKKALNGINWESIYSVSKNFGMNFADFLNGLISPSLFESVGRTVAKCINTAIYNWLSFSKEFDWSNFGKSVGAGINEVLKTIDWKSALDLGSTFGKGIARALNSFLYKTDFYEVGKAIANVLNIAVEFVFSLADTLDFEEVGEAVGNAINGLFENFEFGKFVSALNKFAKGLVKALAKAIRTVKWNEVVEAILTGIGNVDPVTIAVAIAGFKFFAKSGVGAGASALGSTSLLGFLGNSIKSQFSGATLKTVNGGILDITIPNVVLNLGATVQFMESASKTSGTLAKKDFSDFQGETIGLDTSLFITPNQNQFDTVAEYKKALEDYISYVEGIDAKTFDKIFPYALDVDFSPTILSIDRFFGDMENKTAHQEFVLEGLKTQLNNLGDTSSAVASEYTENGKTIITINQDAINSQVNAMNSLTVTSNYQSEIMKRASNSVLQLGTSTGVSTQYLKYFSDGISTVTSKGHNGMPSYVEELLKANEATKTFASTTAGASTAGMPEYAKQMAGITTNSTQLKTATDDVATSLQDSVASFDTAKQYIGDMSAQIAVMSDEKFPSLVESVDSFSESSAKSFEKFYTDGDNSFKDLSKSFEDNVEPMFATEKWNGFLTNVNTSLASGIDTAKLQFTEWQTWLIENFEPYFSLENWNTILSNIPTAFSTTFTNACNTIVSIVNRMIDAINDSVKEIKWDSIEVNGEEVVKSGSAKLFEIPKIRGFAMGGFPDKSNLFYANENGAPELVGRIGNQTAVANNDEIVSAVAGGVESAVSRVMLPYLQRIANSNDEIASKDMSVNIGDRDIARANARGMRAMGRSIISTT